MGQLLFVVSRARPDVYGYLSWNYSREGDVRVIIDRRRRERRWIDQTRELERRQADRRQPARVEGDPFGLSDVITYHLDKEPSSCCQAQEMRTGLTRAELRMREKIELLTGDRGIETRPARPADLPLTAPTAR